VVRQLVEVIALLGNSLLELEELLPLAAANGKVLGSTLTALEGVTGRVAYQSCYLGTLRA